jgi:hypothetical protein
MRVMMVVMVPNDHEPVNLRRCGHSVNQKKSITVIGFSHAIERLCLSAIAELCFTWTSALQQ